MNIQFDIMQGLKKITKKEFVKIFRAKYTKPKREIIEKNLTQINRDYGIINYHDQGFLFKWPELIVSGVNFGEYITSFNIHYPDQMITVGGNLQEKQSRSNAIHLNIYEKATDILPNIYNGRAMKMCFWGNQHSEILEFTRMGQIATALQVPKNMFAVNDLKDGMGKFFGFWKCRICDDNIIRPDEPQFDRWGDPIYYPEEEKKALTLCKVCADL
jgi:hypothetical protein